MASKRNKLTMKDIDKMSVLSLLEQVCFSFERMQAPGFCWSLTPALKKIYGDDTEGLARAMTTYMEFINTEPHMATFIQGLDLSLEEAGQDNEMIKNINAGLFGPLAGLGDAIFWFTLLPIIGAVCISLASKGNPLGPVLFIIAWVFLAFSRVFFGRIGYSMGTRAVEMISQNAASITKAAGILGVTVVGGLIPSYIEFSLAWAPELPGFGEFSLQSEIFDTIFPNILPLLFVFFLYWLFKKKKVNTIALIISIIVISVLAAAVGVM